MTPVWKMGRDQWQATQGVKRPYIAEISPSQYAGLSRRAKVEHDFRRAREWQASADCAEEYGRLCHVAYREDLHILLDPELHPDAKDAIRVRVRAAEAELEEERFRAARDLNQIQSPTDVRTGDRIFDIMTREYVTVTKSLKKSITVRSARLDRAYSALARRFTWLSHDDLKDAVKNRLPITTRDPYAYPEAP